METGQGSAGLGQSTATQGMGCIGLPMSPWCSWLIGVHGEGSCAHCCECATGEERLESAVTHGRNRRMCLNVSSSFT